MTQKSLNKNKQLEVKELDFLKLHQQTLMDIGLYWELTEQLNTILLRHCLAGGTTLANSLAGIKKARQHKLRYRQMLRDINNLVDNDFGLDMEGKYFTNTKFTHKESMKMADILAKIYGISHTIDCEACAFRKGYVKNSDKK